MVYREVVAHGQLRLTTTGAVYMSGFACLWAILSSDREFELLY